MKEQLQSALKDAMREKNRAKLDTLRGILSAIQYEEMQKKIEPLPAEGIAQVLQRELKKRREEIEFAEKGGRPELLEKINAEIAIIEPFLPKQLSADELEQAVRQIAAQNGGAPSFGVIMKGLQEHYNGQYDGKAASEIVRKVLST
jgi:uncharacterized protein YqeY